MPRSLILICLALAPLATGCRYLGKCRASRELPNDAIVVGDLHGRLEDDEVIETASAEGPRAKDAGLPVIVPASNSTTRARTARFAWWGRSDPTTSIEEVPGRTPDVARSDSARVIEREPPNSVGVRQRERWASFFDGLQRPRSLPFQPSAREHPSVSVSPTDEFDGL